MAAARSASGAPEQALAELDALPEPERQNYQPWWAARADALQRLGRKAEASAHLKEAQQRATDPALAAWLKKRLEAYLRES